MRFPSLLLGSAILISSVIAGCGEKGTDPDGGKTPKNDPSSFKTLQTELLATKCATSGCHAGTAPAGGLSLEPAVAYANLVNVAPANPAALADGMKRVFPGSAEKSFLLRKLSGDLGPAHGERMPLGSSALDGNAVEFVRQWIAAGAPQTGVVADSTLLSNPAGAFVPPPPPEHGIQVKMGPFDIGPGGEREVFYYTRATNSKPIIVNKYQVKMRDNSHHFIMYKYPQGSPFTPPPGVFRDQGGDMEPYAAYRQFFLGAQVSDFTFEFPEGVGIALPANAGLDLNSHYVNGTQSPVKGEVYVNLHTIESAKRLATDLFWVDDDFVLMPYQNTTVRGYISTDKDADVFMLTSHTHRRGKSFKIYIDGGSRNGELIYESTDWHLPTVKAFNPPLRINKGEKLRYEAVYYNESEFPVRFGLKSDDEMCIVAGYYAPVL